MTKEKIKNFTNIVWGNVSMFLWMLLPMTPMISTIAFAFLETNNVWFWVLSLVPTIPFIITRPSIGSCSQWENVYIQSILSAVVFLILRLCGIFPLV